MCRLQYFPLIWLLVRPRKSEHTCGVALYLSIIFLPTEFGERSVLRLRGFNPMARVCLLSKVRPSALALSAYSYHIEPVLNLQILGPPFKRQDHATYGPMSKHAIFQVETP